MLILLYLWRVFGKIQSIIKFLKEIKGNCYEKLHRSRRMESC